MTKPSKKAHDQTKKLALKLVGHHFPKKKISIEQLGGGITNYVFAVQAGKEDLVVRISDQVDKINHFMKEQWATSTARLADIPVPEILEVGNSIIPLPYMISRKIEGEIAVNHPARVEVLNELGRLAAAIHRIPTKGYGQMFDWSQNSLSKNESWKQYLAEELRAKERISMLEDKGMIPQVVGRRLNEELTRIMTWKGSTCLQHGDLRLKNVMINDKAKITAIIDWEQCISSIGPFWDISIALHDLSIDGQQSFLDGYGVSGQKLIKDSAVLKTFNLLNYAPIVDKMLQARDKKQLAYYKARLHGALDMFCM